MNGLLERETLRHGTSGSPFLSWLKEYGLSPPVPLASSFPAITAAACASLNTGCYPQVHGVNGGRVGKLPRQNHAVTELLDGFSGKALLVPPVWVLAAEGGVKTCVYQGTQMFPVKCSDRRAVDRNLALFDFLGQGVGSDRVIRSDCLLKVGGAECSLQIMDSKFTLRAAGQNKISVTDDRGRQTLVRGVDGRISLAVFSGPKRYSCYLVWLAGDYQSKDFVLYHSRPGRIGSNLRGFNPGNTFPPPVGGGAFAAYSKGELGLTRPEGGDGRAERLYLDTVRVYLESYEETVFRLRQLVGVSALEFYYFGVPDEGLHHWGDLLRREGPDQWFYWSLMREMMEMTCQVLQSLFAAHRPRTFFLVADHGFESSSAYFYVNEVLAEAGLLAWKDKYTVDLSATRILCVHGSSYMLVVNRANRPSGIVPDSDVQTVVSAAIRALHLAHDPRSGKQVVKGTWQPEVWAEIGTSGVRQGDLYLELEHGYSLSHWSNGGVTIAPKAVGRGGHGGWPLRPGTRGSLLVSSTERSYSIPSQASLPQIGATVLRDLGLELPDYMRGNGFATTH